MKRFIRRLLPAMLLAMTGVNLCMLWNAREAWFQGYGDFAAFYTAGRLVLDGHSRQLYDRDAQWAVQQEFASEVKIRRGPLPYIRPPFEALLFALFAIWRYPVALFLWTLLKVILLSAIARVAVRRECWGERFPPWIAGQLALGTFPVFMDFLQGQDSVLLAFVMVVVFWQLRSGRDYAAGLVLGLGLFKFHLILPFLAVVLLAGRKKLAAGFAAAAVVLVATSAALVGWHELIQYPNRLLALSSRAGVGVMTPEAQINLRGLLTLVAGRSPSPGRLHWILLPVALIAISYAGTLWRKSGDRMLVEGFALALITAIVTSYYAYSYDLTSLAVPLLASLGQRREISDRFTSGLEFTGVFLLLLTPLYWFLKLRVHSEFLIVLPLIAVWWALARRLRQSEPVAAVARHG